jgi:hypothetical protein
MILNFNLRDLMVSLVISFITNAAAVVTEPTRSAFDLIYSTSFCALAAKSLSLYLSKRVYSFLSTI